MSFTATSGAADDFIQSTPFTVTFSSGVSNGSTADVLVQIIDDDVSEAPETFDLSISVSSSAMVVAGSPDLVTVTITDSDSELMECICVHLFVCLNMWVMQLYHGNNAITT